MVTSDGISIVEIEIKYSNKRYSTLGGNSGSHNQF